MNWLIIAALIFGGICGYLTRIYEEASNEKCPREIRGYNCKGDDCDHSRAAVAEAEWDMRK